MDCTACFGPDSALHKPTIDLPQPRWVGPNYHAANPRILVVMLNPGQGDGPQLEQNLVLKDILHRYKRGATSLTDVLDFQRNHMKLWGRPRGRFLPFYTTALGLNLDLLSFLNVALCATKENKYPRHMLNRCFSAHSASVAVALRPDIVLLSGSATKRFRNEFSRRLPNAKVLHMIHYAHRKGAKVEAAELARIRAALAKAACRHLQRFHSSLLHP